MSSMKRDLDPYERNRLSSEKSSNVQSSENSLPSDTQLIISAQEGDIQAFNLIYKRYRYEICLYLTRMVFDRGVGEELTQETFLKAWKALNTLRDAKKFLNWIYRIAKHEAYNYFRHHDVLSSQFSNQTLEDLDVASISGPEEQVVAQEYFKWALAQISPENCRACLILYHIHGRSIAEIAEDLGIRQSSVRQYISSGLNQLKKNLE